MPDAPPSLWASDCAIGLASAWAILAACAIGLQRAVDWVLYNGFHCDFTVLRCVHLTDTKGADHATLWTWILIFAGLQATAAVMALLLPSRHHGIRYALSLVALGAVILNHCMYAIDFRIVLAADPTYNFYKISSAVAISIYAVGDISSLVVLLIPRGENKEEEE